MAAVAFAISFYLRVGGTIGEYSAEAIALWVVLFTAVSAAVFASMRLYRGVWRYASLDDLLGIARAVTLASLVFLPVMFLKGFIGSLFREFGIVVAGAVLISAFVSLTITPVLNVVLNRKSAGKGRFYERTEPFFRSLESGYQNRLERFVSRKGWAFALLLSCVGVIFFVGSNLQSELAPLEDKSNIRFTLLGPEGASYNYMTQAGEEFNNYLIDSLPERQFAFQMVPSFFGTGMSSMRKAPNMPSGICCWASWCEW